MAHQRGDALSPISSVLHNPKGALLQSKLLMLQRWEAHRRALLQSEAMLTMGAWLQRKEKIAELWNTDTSYMYMCVSESPAAARQTESSVPLEKEEELMGEPSVLVSETRSATPQPRSPGYDAFHPPARNAGRSSRENVATSPPILRQTPISAARKSDGQGSSVEAIRARARGASDANLNDFSFDAADNIVAELGRLNSEKEQRQSWNVPPVASEKDDIEALRQRVLMLEAMIIKDNR